MRTPRSCFSHVVKKGSHWQHFPSPADMARHLLGDGSGLSDVEEGIFAFTGLHSDGNERPLNQDLHLRQ